MFRPPGATVGDYHLAFTLGSAQLGPMIMLRLTLAAALFAAPLSALPVSAQAQAQAQATVKRADALRGRPLHDAKGVMLGVIEKVVLDAHGQPAQVLVGVVGHPSVGLRSLSVSGLVADGAGFSTPLTKAEFDSMPAVQLEEPGV